MMKMECDNSIMLGLLRESSQCKILKETENIVERELSFYNMDRIVIHEKKMESSIDWKVIDQNGKQLNYHEVVQLFALANLGRQVRVFCQAD